MLPLQDEGERLLFQLSTATQTPQTFTTLCLHEFALTHILLTPTPPPPFEDLAPGCRGTYKTWDIYFERNSVHSITMDP